MSSRRSVEVVQVSPHPGMIVTFSADGRRMWTQDEYNQFLLHLRQPLQLSQDLRPVCIPNATEPGDTQKLIQSSGTGLLAGWHDNPEQIITLNVKFPSVEECRRLWRHITVNPFKDHICGYNTAEGTAINPEMTCVESDSGVFVRQGNRTLIVGILINRFSNIVKGICDEFAVQYFAVLNAESVAWIKRVMSCGPDAFSCKDGVCVPRSQLCDTRRDCADASDEIGRASCRERV